jgi:hypothetical protein
MKAENLYNGPELTGCCFSFWIPMIEVLPPKAKLPTGLANDNQGHPSKT